MHPDVDGYLPCPDVGSMRLNQAAGPKLIDQDQRADCRGGEPGGANGWDNHSVATSDPLDEELTHRRTAAGENRHPPSVAVLVAVRGGVGRRPWRCWSPRSSTRYSRSRCTAPGSPSRSSSWRKKSEWVPIFVDYL
jgi:hypothetical protein